MKFIFYCNKVIEYSFYLLFFLVPLYFTNNTSELYELNKMWLTWGLTIVITAAWISKSIAQKRLAIQRTPLDIPIFLFFASQFLSTIFSMDFHTSMWGYYSRFNGGFLSILSYTVLYYAFSSNYRDIADLNKTDTGKFTFPVRLILFAVGLLIFPLAIRLAAPPVQNPENTHSTFLLFSMVAAFFFLVLSLPYSFFKRTLFIGLISGLIVALWGIPSHFGADPTCYLFRGQFDVSCWTSSFYPTVRMFSTLGQPAWLAAYVGILLPIAIAYMLLKRKVLKEQFDDAVSSASDLFTLNSASLFGLVILLYLSLLFSNTKGGFIAFWIGNGVFWLILLAKKVYSGSNYLKYFLLINLTFLIINFFCGTPVQQLNFFTLRQLSATSQGAPAPEEQAQAAAQPATAAGELGGTDSGKIRLYVWKGAVDIWKAHPIFGTGVETFAFAYYKHRPAGHNLTSEWDYLYNKAHNEYLNYLATTGIVGLGTYLAIIGLFIFLTLRWLLTASQNYKTRGQILPVAAFLAGYVSILISNFFGFSVVIINLYFYFLPLFAWIVMEQLVEERVWSLPKSDSKTAEVTGGQWVMISILIIIGLYLNFLLYMFRKADIAYALGNNLDNVQEYQSAYPKLQEAVSLRPGEPVFKDEFALNSATLATLLLLNKESASNTEVQQQAAALAQQAVTLDDEIIANHPNNIVFWKNRVRIFYTLSQADPRFTATAIDAMKQVSILAPTDAKVMYNLGIIYKNNGSLTEARRVLEKATQLKPDYRDAYYALGMTLHDLAVDKNKNVTDPTLVEEAKAKLRYSLEHISPNDKELEQTLKSWE